MLRIGSVNKGVELVCDVTRGTPMFLTDATEYGPVALQSVVDAVGDQRYASYADGELSLVCASVRDGVETTYRLDMAPSDEGLIVNRVSVLGLVALPTGCVDMRRDPRRKGRGY